MFLAAGPEGLEAVFLIHPSAMPPESVLYFSTVLIHTASPRPAGAFTTWVLKQDRLGRSPTARRG